MTGAYVLLAASAAAAYTDLRFRRIPNALTIALLLAGLGLRAMEGAIAVLIALAIFGALIAAGAALFGAGIAGGGDVKIIAAGGAALGFPDVLIFLGCTALAGGLLALIAAARRGRLRAVLRNVSFISAGAFTGVRASAPLSGASFPYAFAILAGACATVLSHFVTLHLLRTSL